MYISQIETHKHGKIIFKVGIFAQSLNVCYNWSFDTNVISANPNKVFPLLPERDLSSFLIFDFIGSISLNVL